MSEAVCFFAAGRPRTKGSTRSFTSPHGHPVTKGDNKNTKAWQGVVAYAANEAGVTPHSGPVDLTMAFYFARPRGHYGSGKNAERLKDSARELAPTTRNTGDLDKLVRAVLDALTGVAFADDSQVVKVMAQKCWVEPMRPEGVRVVVGFA